MFLLMTAPAERDEVVQVIVSTHFNRLDVVAVQDIISWFIFRGMAFGYPILFKLLAGFLAVLAGPLIPGKTFSRYRLPERSWSDPAGVLFLLDYQTVAGIPFSRVAFRTACRYPP